MEFLGDHHVFVGSDTVPLPPVVECVKVPGKHCVVHPPPLGERRGSPRRSLDGLLVLAANLLAVDRVEPGPHRGRGVGVTQEGTQGERERGGCDSAQPDRPDPAVLLHVPLLGRVLVQCGVPVEVVLPQELVGQLCLGGEEHHDVLGGVVPPHQCLQPGPRDGHEVVQPLPGFQPPNLPDLCRVVRLAPNLKNVIHSR